MTMQHPESDVLEDYLSGELAPEHDAAVHAHLESCAACRDAHDQAAAVRDWIRAAARAEEREFPATIAARVRAAIATPVPTPFERLRAWWRLLIAVPVAAVAVAMAFAFGPLRPATTPLRVAAAYYIEAHNAQAAQAPLADRSIVTAASVMTADHTASLPLVDAADIRSADGNASAE
jgi:predicted anti-sigma-YlaC factor YlaD